MCSINTLMPIPMSMIPPMSSAGNLKRRPIVAPMRKPMSENTHDTMPIMMMEDMMSESMWRPIHSKETPTARASILVANANRTTTDNFSGSKAFASSFLK